MGSNLDRVYSLIEKLRPLAPLTNRSRVALGQASARLLPALGLLTVLAHLTAAHLIKNNELGLEPSTTGARKRSLDLIVRLRRTLYVLDPYQ